MAVGLSRSEVTVKTGYQLLEQQEIVFTTTRIRMPTTMVVATKEETDGIAAIE
jgi:DNA-binding transcriptional regulator YhcF (GntR family)